MKLKISIWLLVFFFSINSHAQVYVISDSNSTEYFILEKGQTLKAVNSAVYVYTRLGQLLLTAHLKKIDSLMTLQKERLSVLDSLSSTKDSLNLRLNNIIEIQNKSFDSLMVLMHKMDSLVIRSTANTDRTLAYIDKVKFSSYVTATMLGGIAGGFAVGSTSSDASVSFNWYGALLGSVIGFGINYLFLK